MATPLHVVGRGALAGYAGMAAMAAAQPLATAIRQQHGGWLPRWGNAPPAARVARRIIQGVGRRKVSRRHIQRLNVGMHAVYAPLLGASYAVVEASVSRRPLQHGVVFGLSVWGLRAALLPGLKLGEPLWERRLRWNLVDAGMHLGFGLGVAAAYRGLERGDR